MNGFNYQKYLIFAAIQKRSTAAGWRNRLVLLMYDVRCTMYTNLTGEEILNLGSMRTSYFAHLFFKWSCGRVARLSSAKAATAVRIRSGPPDKDANKCKILLRGNSKPVILEAEFLGIADDGYGQNRAGLSLQGKLSHKEFGLTWNSITEAGQIVAADEVRIFSEIQLIKQPLST